MLAKPDTYETFVETNGLRLKPEILELQKLKNEDIDIFSAGLLEQKRGRIIEALSEALPGLIDKKLQEKDYDRSYTLCNDVLPNHNDFRALNQLYQNCTEIAPARIAQTTLDKAVARAESADTLNAAEAADWLVLPRVYDAPEDAVAAAEAKLNAPRQRIADLILVTAEKAIVANRNETIDKSICPVAYDAPDIIKNAMKLCASRIGEHNVAVEEAQCDAAVNAAGKAREIANANIRLFLDGYLGGREREMNIRKLICDSRGHIDIEISGDGWFGSARDLTLKCGGVFIYALFSREKNGAKFRQGARNGAGCGGVKGCGVVQLGGARKCANCAVLLRFYLHHLRFKRARLSAFKAGFIPAFFCGVIRGGRRRRRRLGRRFGRLRVRGRLC